MKQYIINAFLLSAAFLIHIFLFQILFWIELNYFYHVHFNIILFKLFDSIMYIEVYYNFNGIIGAIKTH